MIDFLYSSFLMQNKAKSKIIVDLLDKILTKLCAKRGIEKELIET